MTVSMFAMTFVIKAASKSDTLYGDLLQSVIFEVFSFAVLKLFDNE